MSGNYTPTPVVQGYQMEVTMNTNFTDIATAMAELMNRVDSATNAMGQVLDMGGFNIINLPEAAFPTSPIRLAESAGIAIPEVVQTVTYADALSIDTDAITMARVVLTGNPTITFTGSPSDGQAIILVLDQDSTGSRTVTWEARVRYGTDIPSLTLTTTASKKDYIMFRYDIADDKYDVLAFNRGF